MVLNNNGDDIFYNLKKSDSKDMEISNIIKYDKVNVRCQMSDVKCQMSNVKC